MVAFTATVGLAVGCGEEITPPTAPVVDSGTTAGSDAGMVVRTMSSLSIVDGAGASWRITGEAAAGTSDDLASVPGHNAFWFAWSVFHPGTAVFGRDADIRDAVIQGSSECTVPCDQVVPACSGRDCIPSLESPEMVPASHADAAYLDDMDEVLGVVTESGARAYPHNILWWHEIVNESVDGEDFAVTFCPLTGSGLRFDRNSFVEGMTVELGVSGNLYNSNLTMYDRSTESFWNQMRAESVLGSERGSRAPVQPVHEMTWGAWRALYPDTVVVSGDTGHSRNYRRYPYTDYRTNHANTFRRTDPTPDGAFENKQMTFGLIVEDEVRAYVWSVLEETAGARQGLVNDEVGGVPVAVVFDLDQRYVHAFDRRVAGMTTELSLLVEPEE